MMFIELQAWNYHNGGYMTVPVACNINEISNITEESCYSVDGCRVIMNNGTSYFVKNEYNDIISMIRNGVDENDRK